MIRVSFLARLNTLLHGLICITPLACQLACQHCAQSTCSLRNSRVGVTNITFPSHSLLPNRNTVSQPVTGSVSPGIMVLSHPTIEWSSLQDVFYRKSELYSLSWGIENLADYQVAAASNAGLLALVRDPNRLVSVGKASLLKPKILVYTSAGQLIESIPWDPTVRIISLGFNALEQLVVVLEEGTVRIYTLLSPCPSSSTSSSYVQNSGRPQPVEATSNAYYTQHSLGPEATETGVLDARIWARGLVALVGARRFIEWRFPSLDQDADKEQEPSFAFASADDDTSILPVPELLPPPDPTPALPSGPFASSQMLPTAWSLVPPDVSSTGLTTVLIARGQTLLALTRSTAGPSSPGTSCQDMRLSRGPFHAIRPSPNGKLLALLTDDMKLWVVSSDLSRSLSEFDVAESGAYKDASEVQSNGITGEPSTGKGGLGGTGIRSIEWCGNNTVALAFNEEVVMVGPFGDSIRYPYLGSVHLVGELDGLRVISSDKHEFLQKVPGESNLFPALYRFHSQHILSPKQTSRSKFSDQGQVIQLPFSSMQPNNTPRRAQRQTKVSEPSVRTFPAPSTHA